ncbi:hypothetical protein THRCLA_09583 [Thraustotheca clavata]|uniref:Pre-rRNA-processing protein Ipi1 N-terminal domain-containing protein n=1 Tax=Thraustotheca clavata TaxID=74557 RepID=A0A1V9YVL3_9STRA|nr:hypothetical protein THRCLA_09583 [Thraustotheca clavata]
MVNLKGKQQKKKPGDFKRPKRKVGRKVTPSNVTNASITSRRINLTEQSVLTDKTGVAVTHRNQTLADILTKMAHYNAHVRRDALFSLKELAGLHPITIATNLSAVLERVLVAMMDDEEVVREACVAAWKSCLTNLIAAKAEAVMEPFASLISVYFCSGLTHIKTGVRQDVLLHIDAMLEIPAFSSLFARCLQPEQCGQLLENIKDLVSPKTTTVQVKNSYSLLAERNKSKQAQMQTQVLKGRYFAVATVHKFLSALTSNSSALNSAGKSIQTERNFVLPKTLLIYPTPQLVGWAPSQGTQSTTTTTTWGERSISLLKALLALWMEAQNEQANLSQESLKHMVLIVECATMIVHEASSFIDTNTMNGYEKAFFEDFPHTSPDPLRIDLSTLHYWNTLNLAIAQFGCKLLRKSVSVKTDLQVLIASYLATEFSELKQGKESRTVAHSASTMKTRLDILYLLLERQSHEDLLRAFTELYMASTPQSTMFRTCTAFAIQFLEATLHAKPNVKMLPPPWELTLAWMKQMGCFLQLPHAESNHDETLSKLFRVCIAILKRLPEEHIDSPDLNHWLSNVVSFFTETSETNWLGAMTPATQIQAVSCIYHIPKYPVNFLKTLALCCKSSQIAIDAKSFVVDIIAKHEARFDRASILSFYLSTLFAPTNQQIAGQVCQTLTWMSLGASLSSILAPLLSKQTLNGNVLPLVLAYVACLRSSSIVFMKAGQNLDKRAVPEILQTQVTSVFSHIITASEPTSLLLHQVVDGMVYCNGAFIDVVNHFFKEKQLSALLTLLREVRLRPLVNLYKNELVELVKNTNSDNKDILRQIRNELQLITKESF